MLKAINIIFSIDKFTWFVEDGGRISIPLECFPLLRNATMGQLNDWRFICGGEGIHWLQLDEDILASIY